MLSILHERVAFLFKIVNIDVDDLRIDPGRTQTNVTYLYITMVTYIVMGESFQDYSLIQDFEADFP